MTDLSALDQSERILALVHELARELRPAGPDVSMLGLDHQLDRDFGLDSLARVELVERMERELGAGLDVEALIMADTPRDLLRVVTAGRETQAAEAGITQAAAGAIDTPPESIASIVEALDWHASHHGERTHMTLLHEGERAEDISFARLREAAVQVAAGLSAHGVGVGDRVALMLPTGFDFFTAFHGALRARAVPVPLYPPARPSQLEEHMRRIAGIIANSGAVWLIADARVKPLARVLRALCPGLRGTLTVEELSAGAAKPPFIPPKPEEIAFLQYTSGSTGEPKGVVLTHANLVANLKAMQRVTGIDSRDVFVSWLPLYHDMGLIGAGLGSLLAGFHLVLMSPLDFLARPKRWLSAIHRYQATVSAAPNFAYEICANKLTEEDLAGLDLSSWRLAFNGAEPVSPATLERFAARMAKCGFRAEAMTPVYGLAECSLGLCFPPPGRGPRIDTVERRALMDDNRARPVTKDATGAMHIASCGHPIPDHDLRIVNTKGDILPERSAGRVQFRGPSATSGYFANPAATARLFDGPWLNTGDLGYLADGELFITGREKDIIIRAGHNIHPQELEEAIGRIDSVRKGGVVVFPASDARSGTERLVVLAETHSEDEAAHQRMRQEIERLALDILGMPVDEVVLAPPRTILKTSSGKLRRAACRQAFEQGRLLAGARPPLVQWLRLRFVAVWARLRRTPHALFAGAWGLWAWLVFATAAPVFWLLIVLLPGLATRRTAAKIGARLALTLAGVAPRIEGRSNLAARGPLIIVANHASYVDGMLLTAVLPPRFGYIAKAELLANPFAALPLKRLGAVFVARFEAARGAEDTQAIEARLRAGDGLVFFPEGTFRDAPGLLPFRLGAFLVATRSGVPVVPTALRGTRSLLPGSSHWPRFARLRVTFDAALTPQGSDWQATLALRDASRARILAGIDEPDTAGGEFHAKNLTTEAQRHREEPSP